MTRNIHIRDLFWIRSDYCRFSTKKHEIFVLVLILKLKIETFLVILNHCSLSFLELLLLVKVTNAITYIICIHSVYKVYIKVWNSCPWQFMYTMVWKKVPKDSYQIVMALWHNLTTPEIQQLDTLKKKNNHFSNNGSLYFLEVLYFLFLFGYPFLDIFLPRGLTSHLKRSASKKLGEVNPRWRKSMKVPLLP